jgi:CRP-like cAMP-binding protein
MLCALCRPLGPAGGRMPKRPARRQRRPLQRREYGRNKVEERLARWLLLTSDRLDNSELPLTHEFLAMMLAVRRPGVTVAIQDLEQRALISSERLVGGNKG